MLRQGMRTPKHVICCGNVAFDLIADSPDKKGGFSIYATPGGSVFNTAILASRLGANVSVMSKAGTDLLADSLVEIMAEERISARFVVRDPNVKTGLAFASIDKKGNSSYLFYKTETSSAAFKKNDIPGSAFKNTAIFHTGSAYSYDDYTWHDALSLARKAKASGAMVSFDPNWRSSRVKNRSAAVSRVRALANEAYIFKLSDADAEGITGAKTLDAALKKLGRDAFVTLGDKGSFYWNGQKRISQPAFKVKVADTVGAGDAFTAGLIHRYITLGRDGFEGDMPGNLRFSSAVAAIICTAKGATQALKNLPQVTKFLASQESR
jgi:fructokinase